MVLFCTDSKFSDYCFSGAATLTRIKNILLGCIHGRSDCHYVTESALQVNIEEASQLLVDVCVIFSIPEKMSAK